MEEKRRKTIRADEGWRRDKRLKKRLYERKREKEWRKDRCKLQKGR